LDAQLAVEAARTKKDERLALADSVVLTTGRKHAAPVVSGDPDLKGKSGVAFIGT
jgi:hypothetical protein